MRNIDIKKTEKLLKLVLKQAKEKEVNVKKGCGWAVKTITAFHPDLARKYEDKILNDKEITTWVKNKLKMGFEKSKKVQERLKAKQEKEKEKQKQKQKQITKKQKKKREKDG